MKLLLSILLLLSYNNYVFLTCAKTTKTKEAPPPFFLQDPTDSLCLSGETFKRCSIDTLFYVVGSPGTYTIHKRPPSGITAPEDDEDDEHGVCISKKSCKDNEFHKINPVILAKCTHCGAKQWNILGDGDTGYVLTEGGNDDSASSSSSTATSTTSKDAGSTKTCIFRQGNNAMTAPCDSTDVQYTPLQLRFASLADIKTMSSLGARFIGAASDGDIDTIKTMINDDKIDINVRDWDELTALIPAASGGHYDICKYLIEKGIDVNAADKDGITALMEASIMGHSTIVQYFIEAGATIDSEASSDVTALWLAASEGQVDVMKVLLEKGALATNTRADGITALMTAAVGGHVAAVQLLIEHDADPTTADKEGLTPLMNAAENGTVPILQVLVEATKNDPTYLNAVSNTGFTALIIAAAHGHTDAVLYLIKAGANVDTTAAENKVTALMFASASNHIEVVRALVDNGCTVDAKHTNGGTALLESATGGAVDAMKILIEKGAQVDISDDDGVTPLMAIASQGNITGVNLIVDALQSKFDNDATKLTDFINLFSKSGGSTVMFATAGGHVNATKRLIELGANLNAIARATPDYIEKIIQMKADGTSNEIDDHVDGVTALHVAAQGGHLDTVQLLIDMNVDVKIADDNSRTALLLAIKGNYGEVSTRLIKAGSDPNTVFVDDDGIEHNLLFDAIMVENNEFAKLLIEMGADIYYVDDKKVSTLLQASHRGLVDVVQALLQKQASNAKVAPTILLDGPSDEGITPLIAAASEGKDEVVKLLIDYNVNVNAIDQDSTTALMAASARGHYKVVQVLLEHGKAKVNEQNVDGHTALMFAYNGKNQVETLWERYVSYVNDAKTERKVTAKDSAAAAAVVDDELDDNGTGVIIRDALDNHLKLIDILLKHSADTSIKDKEGHIAKDFDYNPDVDEKLLEKSKKTAQMKDDSKYEL